MLCPCNQLLLPPAPGLMQELMITERNCPCPVQPSFPSRLPSQRSIHYIPKETKKTQLSHAPSGRRSGPCHPLGRPAPEAWEGKPVQHLFLQSLVFSTNIHPTHRKHMHGKGLGAAVFSAVLACATSRESLLLGVAAVVFLLLCSAHLVAGHTVRWQGANV